MVTAAAAARYRIEDILHTRKLQSRVKPFEMAIIERYATRYEAEGDDALPPVLLANVNGVLMLVDGYHRVRARLRLKRTDVMAKVIECASEAEAMYRGAFANIENGLTLTRKDVWAMLDLYVKAGLWRKANGRAKTYADIAADLGNTVTRSAVYKRMHAFHRAVADQMAKSPQDGARADGSKPGWSEERKRTFDILKNLQSIEASLPGLKTDASRAKAKQRTEALYELVNGAGWPDTPGPVGDNPDF